MPKSKGSFEAWLNRKVVGATIDNVDDAGNVSKLPIVAFGTYARSARPEYFEKCYKEYLKYKLWDEK